MTLLATLRDADVGYDYIFPESYDTRIACRAFLFDAEGNMAYVWSGKNAQHKLPGGGVEAGETLEQALVRELLEETGCHVGNITYLGYLDELRGKGGFKQTSHLYIAHVDGPKGTPEFDANERETGFALKWISSQEAIRLADQEQGSDNYGLNFQNARERKLLEFLPR